MKYNPLIHNRQSTRLIGYDYGREGFYFLTLCTKDRIHLFGKIENGEMILNDAGNIAHQCWMDIPKHFPNTILHNFIIMPNHIHGIIEISEIIDFSENSVRAKNFSPRPQSEKFSPNFKSPSRTVGSIIRGFKIGVTKWMRQNTDTNDVWQRGYYDIIIRDSNSYDRISNYIINNPKKWEKDKFHKK